MSEPSSLHAPIAVIADIHGNRWALEAVLQDIERRGISQIINLGDHVTGPLDPAGTAELLLEHPMINICGNDDRALFAPAEELSPAQRYTREHLTSVQLEWLRTLPTTTVIAETVFACHGDEFDTPYLLEQVTVSGVCLRGTQEISASIAGIAQSVILCAHSHVPRAVSLPSGTLIVNPGSVGLPAYTMDTPVHHAMEAGSPHARYALLRQIQDTWQVEHILAPYASEQAATVAHRNQRADWAAWLATGRAR